MSRSASLSVAPLSVSRLSLVLAAWLAAALVIATSGVLARAPFLMPVIIAAVLVTAAVAYRRSPAVRAALAGLDPRWLIAPHVVRAPIGALFLIEHARGQLPGAFAMRAGWGDLAAGIGALALLVLGARRGPGWARAARLWNLFGALDLAVVLVTAQYLILVAHDPLMTGAILRMPYPLLPTFVVPLMLALHLAVWRRLRAQR